MCLSTPWLCLPLSKLKQACVDRYLLLLGLNIAHTVPNERLVLDLFDQALVAPFQVQQGVGDVILAVVGGDVVYASFLGQGLEALQGPAALLLVAARIRQKVLGGLGLLTPADVLLVVVVELLELRRGVCCVF